MIRGLRCKPLSVHCRKVADTASAAIRGSTIPGSILAISRDSNMGEWAVGMLSVNHKSVRAHAKPPVSIGRFGSSTGSRFALLFYANRMTGAAVGTLLGVCIVFVKLQSQAEPIMVSLFWC